MNFIALKMLTGDRAKYLGGLLRFIRFEMDHRRNTAHRGRSSLGIYRK
jgi:hypothetical protein